MRVYFLIEYRQILAAYKIRGGSNMTRTGFFFLNHNCQTLTCTCQPSTYSPPESTHFFQHCGSILMPFSKKTCGWRRIHSQTVWVKASRLLKFTTDSNNSTEKCVSYGPVCLSGVSASESAWRMNRMIIGQRRRHPDCSGVDTPPTTSLSWKGHQDASRTLEKMCWLQRGVHWRLTCASECLAIMVLKKISPGHIWTALYFKWLNEDVIPLTMKAVNRTEWQTAWLSWDWSAWLQDSDRNRLIIHVVWSQFWGNQ